MHELFRVGGISMGRVRGGESRLESLLLSSDTEKLCSADLLLCINSSTLSCLILAYPVTPLYES